MSGTQVINPLIGVDQFVIDPTIYFFLAIIAGVVGVATLVQLLGLRIWGNKDVL